MTLEKILKKKINKVLLENQYSNIMLKNDELYTTWRESLEELLMQNNPQLLNDPSFDETVLWFYSKGYSTLETYQKISKKSDISTNP